MKIEIEKIRDRLVKVNQFYTLFNEERRYFKRARLRRKKTVIYRQMVTASQDCFDILKLLHRYEYDIIKLPEEIQIQLHERLDFLINEHQNYYSSFLEK